MLKLAPQGCYLCRKKGEMCLYSQGDENKGFFLSGTFHEKISSQLLRFQIWELRSFINLLSTAVQACVSVCLTHCKFKLWDTPANGGRLCSPPNTQMQTGLMNHVNNENNPAPSTYKKII